MYRMVALVERGENSYVREIGEEIEFSVWNSSNNPSVRLWSHIPNPPKTTSILPFSGNYPQAKKPGFFDNFNWETKYLEQTGFLGITHKLIS